jgi:hypothetical protein
MLAGMRSCFPLFFLLTFSAGACLSLQAQINGVPPSVTSMGFGGRAINGVPPSVTSIGFGGKFLNGVSPSVAANGYSDSWSVFGNCCTNFFLPSNPNPLSSGHHHRRKDGDQTKNRADFPIGILEPAYIPYPVPYAEDGDDSTDADSLNPPGQANAGPPGPRVANRDSALKDADPDKISQADFGQAELNPEPEEPVAAQPSTVLVFKDGHKSDVLNYAIVGDTLFDFADGRSRKILLADLDLAATRKANDDLGVDFQIPVTAARQ